MVATKRELQNNVARLERLNRETLRCVEALIPVVAPNDNGYTVCRACEGRWHTGDAVRHRPGCPLKKLITIVWARRLPLPETDVAECRS